MSLIFISFLAWVLTILAPCVLPILPVILAWSTTDNNKKTPILIIISLGVSIIFFSILLKWTAIFIDIPAYFWSYLSWIILIFLWIITLFPNLWRIISYKSKIEEKSNELLLNSNNKSWILKNIFIWFSLWPVFSSCSPTYALILAIILPQSLLFWFINLLSYVLWLSLFLFLIAIFWQKIISKIKIFSNPNWYFKKFLWLIFLLIWLSIFTWFDKYIETQIINNSGFDITQTEGNILNKFYDFN
jgi:cytochrome c-type biogenesis protein